MSVVRSVTYDFTGSVVLITGGGSGIGYGIVRAFLDAGATVAITGRRVQRLEQALEGYPAARTAAIGADVSDGAQVKAMVEEVVRRFGRLDVVVSNAAGYETGSITDLDDQAWAALRATKDPPHNYMVVISRVVVAGSTV